MAGKVKNKSPYDLQRNDVDGALAVLADAVERGAPDLGSLVRTLVMLQDDPAELLRRIPRGGA